MINKTFTLHHENHDRDIFDFKYVYPVVSRRAGGLSLGINLNTNNACNWQCIYCEVPNLSRGKPDPIDVGQLSSELSHWINLLINSPFIEKNCAPDTKFVDVAFSGNGEPTAAIEFHQILIIVVEKLKQFNLINDIQIRLITNGSFIHKNLPSLDLLSEFNGEVWFKIDAGDSESINNINQIQSSFTTIKKNLKLSLIHSKTIIQSCLLKINDEVPSNYFLDDYIKLIKPFDKDIRSIHLYSLARKSHQTSNLKIDRLTNFELEKIKSYLESHLETNIYTFP